MQAGHLHDLIPDAAGIIYEVRVYSLEAASLGHVLHAKQIRAAHCLTSVQFSPTSEHLLLAYGRSAFTFYMHASSHSLAGLFSHSFAHVFIRACMLSCLLSSNNFNHSIIHVLQWVCCSEHAAIWRESSSCQQHKVSCAVLI